MNKARQNITVFEHGKLHYGRSYKGVVFKESHFNALAKLNDLHENKYFTLIHKGIRFSQYVGVIQVDGLSIEILPKIDRTDDNPKLWQDVLIGMLRTTKKLKVHKVGNANVAKQNIHLMDIYFEWFLSEVQLLVRQGLIKKYYKETKNVKTLKGKLEFAGQLQKNSIHKERFYTTHQVYDVNHIEHQILGLALSIVEQFSNGSYLYSTCKTVQLDFPDVATLKPDASIFSRLVFTRKNKAYKTALEIARVIILNFAPNISTGQEKMLALLFDMNSLWEEYVLVRLKQAAEDNTRIYGQNSKIFWKSIRIRPDIVIKKDYDNYIIDTKWKNISNGKPSTEDLRQMYVYNEYWNSNKAMLLYPAIETEAPRFIAFEGDENHQCALGKLNILHGNKLNENIGVEVLQWLS